MAVDPVDRHLGIIQIQHIKGTGNTGGFGIDRVIDSDRLGVGKIIALHLAAKNRDTGQRQMLKPLYNQVVKIPDR